MATTTSTGVRWFTDTRVRVLIGAEPLDLVESEAQRGNMPPLHVHRDHDELFHVLEGELGLFLPGDHVGLRAGDAFLAPKGVPHTYRVESETARWVVGTVPGRFAGFVLATSVPAEGDGYAPPEQMVAPEVLTAEAAARGIEILGPPGTLP